MQENFNKSLESQRDKILTTEELKNYYLQQNIQNNAKNQTKNKKNNEREKQENNNFQNKNDYFESLIGLIKFNNLNFYLYFIFNKLICLN